MKVVAKTVIVILASLASSQVIAQSKPSPFQTSEIFPACKNAFAKSGSEVVAYFQGACVAVIASSLRLAPQLNSQYRFCPPPSMTVPDFLPLLVKFVEANQISNEQHIVDVVNYVGRRNFPC